MKTDKDIVPIHQLVDNLKAIKEYGEFNYTSMFGFDYKAEIDKTIEVMYDYIRLMKLSKVKTQVKQIARKERLLNEEVKTLYDELGSFRAVGKLLHCDPKTVKNRLVEMGYTFHNRNMGK